MIEITNPATFILAILPIAELYLQNQHTVTNEAAYVPKHQFSSRHKCTHSGTKFANKASQKQKGNMRSQYFA